MSTILNQIARFFTPSQQRYRLSADDSSAVSGNTHHLKTVYQFKSLSLARKMDQLRLYGKALGVCYRIKSVDIVIYSYHDFYIEVAEDSYTGNTRFIRCLKNIKKREIFPHRNYAPRL